jgi:CxxC motif-containing protein
MEKKDYICIVCPKSCKGSVCVENEEVVKTEGYDCKNGDKYAVNEYTDPKRMLTTTVTINNGLFGMLPVVATDDISKNKFFDCINYLYGISVDAPVTVGEIIAENICDTGVDIIAARSMVRK